MLTLLPASYAVLKGSQSVLLPVPQIKIHVPAATGLFEALRTLRKKLAAHDHVPPYMVFSDATLRDMCTVNPATLEEMREVKGVGDLKLKKYGQAFLDCLKKQ